MAPYKANTHSSRCTYSQAGGDVERLERRQLFSLCAVTVKLWQGAFNILKCFSCAAATSCRPVCLNCLSQLSAWVNALLGAWLEPQSVAAVTVIRNMHISYELERSLPRSVQYALLSHWRARPTLRIRPVAQSKSEHHKYQCTRTHTQTIYEPKFTRTHQIHKSTNKAISRPPTAAIAHNWALPPTPTSTPTWTRTLTTGWPLLVVSGVTPGRLMQQTKKVALIKKHISAKISVDLFRQPWLLWLLRLRTRNVIICFRWTATASKSKLIGSQQPKLLQDPRDKTRETVDCRLHWTEWTRDSGLRPGHDCGHLWTSALNWSQRQSMRNTFAIFS